MQIRGLPRHIIRGAALASRVCTAHSSVAAHRRELLARWRQAMCDGLSAQQAAKAVGVSRATLYRWRTRPEPRSRRPRRVAQPRWSNSLVVAVRELRRDYPMWGKAKLIILLRREGWHVSESTVGRILNRLIDRGVVSPASLLRRKGPRAARRLRPYAKRLPKGRKPSAPGEIVQLDTLTISLGPGRPSIKQFTASDPASKWTCAHAWRRATAFNAKRFLDKLVNSLPVPIQAIQIDGGSEFKGVFEAECQRRNIELFELPPRSPELNGNVERVNGSWRYEFYACWNLPHDDLDSLNYSIDAFADEFNTWRPHQSLAGMTPAQYLQNLAAEETPPSHIT